MLLFCPSLSHIALRIYLRMQKLMLTCNFTKTRDQEFPPLLGEINISSVVICMDLFTKLSFIEDNANSLLDLNYFHVYTIIHYIS